MDRDDDYKSIVILVDVFCLFLSVDDGALDLCGDICLVKRITQVRSIVHRANFTNAAAKTWPSAQIEIFTMSNTATFPPRIAKAKKIKTQVEYIMRY